MHRISLQATLALLLILKVVALIVGSVRLQRRQPVIQWTWLWILVMLFVELGMEWVKYSAGRTTQFHHATYPVILVVGVYAFSTETKHAGVRRFHWAMIGGFLLLWAWSLWRHEYQSDFNAFIGPTYATVLTLSGAVMIGDRLREVATPPLCDPILVLGLGTLAMFAPAAAVEPVSLAIYPEHVALTRVLWIGRALLHIVGTVLFALVMLWTIPPRFSSGSKLSAGSPPAPSLPC